MNTITTSDDFDAEVLLHIFAYLVKPTELINLSNSSTENGLQIKCGLCHTNLRVPIDRKMKARAAYFNKSKLISCYE